eukprot:TRINITY_DN18018_c0_g1_i1.p1 TRINITY_DN18018_c0_g1~~TRINITY_DN18018_c0_g1_i1.p1  ORF type:complete len:119 (+),score=19.11 TRINITY_DN18018_c0_g1_i1:263-619(+)
MASPRKGFINLISLILLVSMLSLSRAITRMEMLQEIVVYSEDDSFTLTETEDLSQLSSDEERKAAAIANAFQHLHGSEDFSGAEDDDYVSVSKPQPEQMSPLDMFSRTILQKLRGFIR